jgi:hypothetical protein
MAQQASLIAARAPNDPKAPLPKQRDFLLNIIFDFQLEVGSYDDAIATVQPIDLTNRKPYYPKVLEAEIGRKDAASIASTLPDAIEAVKAPQSPINHGASYLSSMTRALAAAGYKAEAQLPFRELEAAMSSPDWGILWSPPLYEFARLQAALGDLPGAIATAGREGPLIVPINKSIDLVMAAISKAQARAGNPRAALATALRIDQPAGRLGPLLVLAEIPPHP